MSDQQRVWDGGDVGIIGMPGSGLEVMGKAGDDAPMVITYDATVLRPEDHVDGRHMRLVIIAGEYAGQIALLAGKNATFKPR